MSGIRFTDEFKRDAVAQVVKRGYSIAERLRKHKTALHLEAQFSQPRKQLQREHRESAEIRRLKKALARVSEVRDILKKAAAYFARDAK